MVKPVAKEDGVSHLRLVMSEPEENEDLPYFNVLVREVWVSHRRVQAKSAEEAMAIASDDLTETEETYREYSHTLEPDSWTVEGPFDGKGEKIDA